MLVIITHAMVLFNNVLSALNPRLAWRCQISSFFVEFAHLCVVCFLWVLWFPPTV